MVLGAAAGLPLRWNAGDSPLAGGCAGWDPSWTPCSGSWVTVGLFAYALAAGGRPGADLLPGRRRGGCGVYFLTLGRLVLAALNKVACWPAFLSCHLVPFP